MLCVQIGIPVLITTAVFFTKHRWIVVGLLVVSIPLSLAISQSIFDHWWNELITRTTTEADMQWIRDHDGGRVIIRLISAIRALLFACAAMGIGLVIHQKTHKRA